MSNCFNNCNISAQISGAYNGVGISKITNCYNIGTINTKFRKGGIYGKNIHPNQTTEKAINNI